jgi:excisionase family DNA binding protein
VVEEGQKELLSVREAADFLGLSVSTIRRYIHDRRLPAYRVAAERVLRIRRGDLEALLSPVFQEETDDPPDENRPRGA